MMNSPNNPNQLPKTKTTYLIFGNPFTDKDNLPIKLLPKLQQQFPHLNFQQIDPIEIENHLPEDKHLRIIDTIASSKIGNMTLSPPEEIKLIKLNIQEDFQKLETNKVYTMHDFDLAHTLKLLKKIGRINSVEIIGIPMEMDEGEALDQIKKSSNNFV